jgi:hypothetical protein
MANRLHTDDRLLGCGAMTGLLNQRYNSRVTLNVQGVDIIDGGTDRTVYLAMNVMEFT